MKKRLITGLRVLAIAVLVLVIRPSEGETQPTPKRITIGIYAPTVQFANSQVRASYMRSLATAIEAQAGRNHGHGWGETMAASGEL